MGVTYRALLVIAENGSKATVDSGEYASPAAAIAALAKLLADLDPSTPPPFQSMRPALSRAGEFARRPK